MYNFSKILNLLMTNDSKVTLYFNNNAAVILSVQSDADRISRDRLKKLEAILSGDTTIALHLQFLIRTNKADLQILKNTKVTLFHLFNVVPSLTPANPKSGHFSEIWPSLAPAKFLAGFAGSQYGYRMFS